MIIMIRLLDGMVQFPLYEISFSVDDETFTNLIYSNEELEEFTRNLNKHSVSYETKGLEIDPILENKCRYVEYLSKTEAEKHLFQGILPKSQGIPLLQKENQQLKQKLEQQEQALLTIMFADME